MNLQLSIAMAANPRSWPIFDGRIKPKGIDLLPSMVLPSELFWRQLKFAEFDISEMSFSSLIMAVAQGDDRFVGLPIFTTKRFFHAGILVRRDSGIERPEDLKGKRVGVPEYQQTAALWSRGALEHEWGVSPRDGLWHGEHTRHDVVSTHRTLRERVSAGRRRSQGLLGNMRQSARDSCPVSSRWPGRQLQRQPPAYF